MDQTRNLLDIRDGPRDIRGMRTSHDPRFFRQQSLQLVEATHRVLGVRSGPPFHLQAQPLRNSQPRGAVGLMVQLGQDQLVAGLELEGRGEVMEQLRRRYPDTYLQTNSAASFAGSARGAHLFGTGVDELGCCFVSVAKSSSGRLGRVVGRA